jgi:hypothetical protein
MKSISENKRVRPNIILKPTERPPDIEIQPVELPRRVHGQVLPSFESGKFALILFANWGHRGREQASSSACG